MVLAGVGVLLFFLLRGDDDPANTASASSTSTSTTSSSSSSAESMSPMTEVSLPPGAEQPPPTDPGGSMTEESSAGDGGQFAGSGDAAVAWVNAMYNGDFTTAWASMCPALQGQLGQLATEDDLTDEDLLAAVFYQGILEGRGITDGSADGVQAGDGVDIVSFTLALDDGSTYNLLVAIDQNRAVCGWQ